jgi:hypothetical protein
MGLRSRNAALSVIFGETRIVERIPMGKRPMVAIAARREPNGLYAIGCAACLLEVRPGPEAIVQGVHRVRLHAAPTPFDDYTPRAGVSPPSLRARGRAVLRL